jgi:hypothetical protein
MEVDLLSPDEHAVSILSPDGSNLDDTRFFVDLIVNPQLAAPKLKAREGIRLERLSVPRHYGGLVDELDVHLVKDDRPLVRLQCGQVCPRRRRATAPRAWESATARAPSSALPPRRGSPTSAAKPSGAPPDAETRAPTPTSSRTGPWSEEVHDDLVPLLRDTLARIRITTGDHRDPLRSDEAELIVVTYESFAAVFQRSAFRPETVVADEIHLIADDDQVPGGGGSSSRACSSAPATSLWVLGV